MIKFSHAALALLSGFIWLAIGTWLLRLGLKFLIEAANGEVGSHPLVDALVPYAGGLISAALCLIALALLVGYMKGSRLLAKSAQKGIIYLQSLPNPASIAKIYPPKYYFLLGGMMLLGFSLKFFGLPSDIRGFIDVAIGAALIQGSLVYLRFGFRGLKTVS